MGLVMEELKVPQQEAQDEAQKEPKLWAYDGPCSYKESMHNSTKEHPSALLGQSP